MLRKLRVFLCHASQDKPLVRQLHQRLLGEGWIDPWLDEDKLLPGQEWDLEIEMAVEAADAVVVCLSGASVGREGYIQREINAILTRALEKPENTIFVIPVRFEACETPRRLKKWQAVDYFPEGRREAAFQRLLKSLRLRAENLGLLAEADALAGGEADEAGAPETGGRSSGPGVEIDSHLGLAALKEILWADFPAHTARPAADILRTPRQRQAFAVLAHLDSADAAALLRQLTPDGMLLIPAGAFPMGSERYDNERPLTEVWVDSFYMARYPVTNGDFRIFMLDGGYARREFWTRAGWIWAQANHRGSPWRWSGQCWQVKAGHPVEWISWYEAMAYANWMAARKNAPYRLPTEAEWEKAASWQADGQVKREYPWGDVFDPRLCNLNNPNGTRPAGAFSPAGDSPYGVADMVGQVWQWTSSQRLPYPYDPLDGREDPEAPGQRTFRGGCWANSDRGFVRCASRYVESNPIWPDMNTNGEYEGPVGLRLALGALPGEGAA